MSNEPDPEVLADLDLRESSVHDRSRTRPTEYALGRWATDADVAWWYCKGLNKANPCPQKAIVGVTADVVEQVFRFNAMLRSRGEPPLDTAELVRCMACRRGIAAQRPAALRKRCDEMAECIRQLKASSDPRRERELIKQIETWGHPDVPGLLQAIDERRRGGKSKRSRDDV